MIDAFTYPHPRTRKAPPSQPQAPTGVLPISRVFSGEFLPLDMTRTVWSGPRCTGPAVIKSFQMYCQSHSNASQNGFEIGYSKEPVNQNAVDRALPKTWTTLTEIILQNFTSLNPGYAFLNESSPPDTFVRFREPLDLIIDQPFFYPVVVYVQRVGPVGFPYFWQLRLTEQVNRRSLALFPSAGQGPAHWTSRTTPVCATFHSSLAQARSCPCSTRRHRTPKHIRGTGRVTARPSTS